MDRSIRTAPVGHLKMPARRSVSEVDGVVVAHEGEMAHEHCLLLAVGLCHSELRIAHRLVGSGEVAAFLAAHPEFTPAPFARTFGFTAIAGGLTIWPAAYDTDGFFVASLRRQA